MRLVHPHKTPEDPTASQKARTPRQRIKILGPKFGPAIRKLAGNASKRSFSKSAGTNNTDKLRLAELISGPLVHAGEQLGLDAANPQDRFWLLGMLAWAIYGATPRGRKKEWLDETYGQLLADVEKVKEQKRDLTEALICKELIMGRLKMERYATKNAATLLRNLQQAKIVRNRAVKQEEIIKDFMRKRRI
jgi:hypothetical protein